MLIDTSQFDQNSMIFDKKIITITDKSVFVPYLPRHLVKYNNWMKDPLIRAQTASDPLTLEEEVQMQISWALDIDKRTFIILDREFFYSLLYSQHTSNIKLGSSLNISTDLPSDEQFEISENNICVNVSTTPDSLSSSCISCGVFTSYNPLYQSLCLCSLCESQLALSPVGLQAAVGDVNLFLHRYLDDEIEEVTEAHDRTNELLSAEIEVMIAEIKARGKGLGRDAVNMIMKHGKDHVDIGRYVVKINDDNIPSINLFSSLGFKEFARVECFQEIHMQYSDPDPPKYDNKAWCLKFGVEDLKEEEVVELPLSYCLLKGGKELELINHPDALKHQGDENCVCLGPNFSCIFGQLNMDTSVDWSNIAEWRGQEIINEKCLFKALDMLNTNEKATMDQVTTISIVKIDTNYSSFISIENTVGGSAKINMLRKRVNSLINSIHTQLSNDIETIKSAFETGTK